MSKNKVINLREEIERDGFGELMKSLEYLAWKIEAKQEVISNMRDAARDAVETASLDFSKFTKNRAGKPTLLRVG